MSRNKEVPGNVLASQAVIQRAAMRLSGTVDRAEYDHREGNEREVWLVAIRVKYPEDEDGEFLLVLSGDSNDGPQVAFHNSIGFGECLRGGLERYLTNNLKWRKDEYRK